MYPIELTKPMVMELENAGFKSLKSADEVAELLSKKSGTTLVVVNSVCGCAAANARPGVISAIKNEKKPDNLVTVFAGVDGDAVREARNFFAPYPGSSPSMGLFKDGNLVHFIERHQIEGRPAQMIAANLVAAFEEFC